MFCNNCGKEVNDNAVVCLNCGAALNGFKGIKTIAKDGPIGVVLGALCILSPILGLVLHLVWKNSKPRKAKGASGCALIGCFVCMFALLIAFVVPRYLRSLQISRTTKAKNAISAIVNVYREQAQTPGFTEFFTIEQAQKHANLDEGVLKNWRFKVIANSSSMYIVATSTPDFADGEGNIVWYDVNDDKFHGYGIDTWSVPPTGEDLTE